MKKTIAIFIYFMIIHAAWAENQNEVNRMLQTLNGTAYIKVCQYGNGNVVGNTDTFLNGSCDSGNSSWIVNMNTAKVEGDPDAVDITLDFRVERGKVDSSGVAIEFDFSHWDMDNYVLAPAAVYNGNRYRVLPIGYPPYIYDEKDCPLDMPVTITDVPHLNRKKEPAEIELLTGSCSTPLIGFYDKKNKRGFFLLTTQETVLGNSGLTIRENPEKESASFVLTAPGIRKKRYVGTHSVPSNDQAKNWEGGDRIELQFRIYNFEAENLCVFYDKFFNIRKALSGENEYLNRIPFRAVSEIILNHHDRVKWFENDRMGYICNRPESDNPFGHIQLGWGGVPLYSFPQVIIENPERLRRVSKSLDAIGMMSSKTGLFYGIFKNGEFFGDNFNEMNKKRSITMIRRNGLAIYFGLQHLDLMRSKGYEHLIKSEWEDMFRRAANGLVDIWKTYGQFGQFLDVESGKMEINNSTGGAINIAALALAACYYNNPEYLEVAEAAGRMYFHRDLEQGYTGGGPAEILQCPDSESSAELAESFVALYEITKKQEWLERAEFAAALFSSWVVSYDYKYPVGSDMYRINAKATGSVWASVQNIHSAPGIYILSGDFLLKLFRATGDKRYSELLKDIVHNVVQYVTTEDNPLGIGSAPGSVSERVNLSDWEGRKNIGMVSAGDSNMAWETVALLSVLQNPGIYLQTDEKKLLVFDHVNARIISDTNGKIVLEIENPTSHSTQVALLAETKTEVSKPLGWNAFNNWPKIIVGNNTKVRIAIDKNNPSGKIEFLK